MEASTPACTRAPQAKSTNAPSTNDARKPTRAAAIAPHSGPITCPTVIADCIAAICRRTSPGSSARPALMNAKVDAAPMKPSTRRARNISGSVRATAMPTNAAPWKYCVAT